MLLINQTINQMHFISVQTCMLGVVRTLEYGTRAILYKADLPRDLGVTKPFSITSKFPGDLGTRDKAEDFEGMPEAKLSPNF